MLFISYSCPIFFNNFRLDFRSQKYDGIFRFSGKLKEASSNL